MRFFFKIMLLSAVMASVSGCREKEEKCLGFPPDNIAHFATKTVGATMTYRTTDGTDSIVFHCGNIEVSDDYLRTWGTKCPCSSTANQSMIALTDTLAFTKVGSASPDETAVSFQTVVDIKAFGLLTQLVFNEPWSDRYLPDNATTFLGASIPYYYDPVPYKVLPEWTAADGTRYTDVYHIDDEASGAAFYLAPGYGIVQAVTPNKTYVLKTE